jgi:hypothetical protein
VNRLLVNLEMTGKVREEHLIEEVNLSKDG